MPPAPLASCHCDPLCENIFDDGNEAEDFNTYALGWFNRCRSLMESPAFLEHLAAIS